MLPGASAWLLGVGLKKWQAGSGAMVFISEEQDVEKLRLEKDQMNQDILESERQARSGVMF